MLFSANCQLAEVVANCSCALLRLPKLLSITNLSADVCISRARQASLTLASSTMASVTILLSADARALLGSLLTLKARFQGLWWPIESESLLSGSLRRWTFADNSPFIAYNAAFQPLNLLAVRNPSGPSKSSLKTVPDFLRTWILN